MFGKLSTGLELLDRKVRSKAIKLNSTFYDRFVYDDRIDVMAEDWDTLILLDGCRHDTFSEENHINGTLERRVSRGSSTGDFLISNFRNSQHHDTIYISANPHLPLTDLPEMDINKSFFATFDLAHDDDYWNADIGTVPPDTVVEKTREVFDQYPNKRYIVHFMQPHYPFIGEAGRDLEEKGLNTGVIGHTPKDPDRAEGMWKQLGGMNMPGNIWHELPYMDAETHELVRRAYRENLRLVLEHVEDLVDELPGKSVISADHGNMIGDRSFPIPVRGYGHPSYHALPELLEVPWLVIDGGDRREIVQETPLETDDPDPQVIMDRLQDLGYTT